MTNPIARLMAQAELNVADLARRTIENVTIPIKVKSREVVAEVVEAATSAAKTIAIKAALALFAAVMLVIALGYALSALHDELIIRTGPISALLIMGGLFAVLALIAVAALIFWPKPKANVIKAEPQEVRDAARVAALSSPARAESIDPPKTATIDPALDMKTGFDAIVSALGEAGFRREQAGLKAGMVIANQMRPTQLAALALIGGFIAGARMSGRRPR